MKSSKEISSSIKNKTAIIQTNLNDLSTIDLSQIASSIGSFMALQTQKRLTDKAFPLDRDELKVTINNN